MEESMSHKMRKQLTVPQRIFPHKLDFSSLSSLFDALPVHQLNNESWPDFKTGCRAGFGVFHANDHIVLKFTVGNDYFKSFARPINGLVNKDNCVEFFIAFSDDAYYNIEYSCLGIGKVAYGINRGKRKFLPETAIEKIKTFSNVHDVNAAFNWEMILLIPISVFKFDKIRMLSGMTCTGNFYKCGDDLPEPHFLTWNTIQSEQPNFHLPEFFGDIFFE